VAHAVVGIVLVAHGLITTMIGFGSMSSPSAAAMQTPSWLGWWPGTLGRSWAFDALNLGSGPALIGGLLWLAAGLALVGAGLGWLGVSVVSNQWQMLALVGAVLGLAALALYFHPFYIVAIVIDVVIVALVWGRVVAAR
jgi:general stress protein CsbA